MVKSGQAWAGLVVTRDATGALAAASVGPAGTLYVNGTANGASVTVSGSNPYKWAVTLPSLTAGDSVSMYITATVGGIATAAVVAEEVSDTERVSDLNDPSAATVASQVRTELTTELGRIDAAITTRLAPTIADRTLDVSSGGEAGVDWANVGSPTTTVNLSGTTVKTATDVETDTADIQSRLPAALVSGRIDANMGAVSNDATAADNLEAVLDGTGGVTLTIKKLTINNTDPTGVGIQVNAYNAANIVGTNRGVMLQGGGNQALYMLSDTATATFYIEGPLTGGKGIAISSPSDGSSLPGASGIYIQTEGGHPAILIDFTDLADAIKIVNSDNGSWVLDDLISAINAKTTNLPASPAAVGSPMTLADDAITAAKFDESTAYPLKQADTGSTAVARTGADADTLKTLSDQVDGVGGSGLTAQETRDAMKLAPSAGAAAAGSIDAHLDSLLAYGAGTGTGTYTDTVTDGVDPLDNVLVQLSTDSAGANMAYRAYTGADGVFVMSPDPGTYYVWFELAGYSFTQGAEVVVT